MNGLMSEEYYYNCCHHIYIYIWAYVGFHFIWGSRFIF